MLLTNESSESDKNQGCEQSHQRIAPVLRVAAGMGGTTGKGEREIAAAPARMGQSAIGQRARLVSQRRGFALRQFLYQGGRGPLRAKQTSADPGAPPRAGNPPRRA